MSRNRFGIGRPEICCARFLGRMSRWQSWRDTRLVRIWKPKSTAGPWACDRLNPNGAAATRGALPAEAQNATQGLVAFEVDTDRSRAMNRLACPDQIARVLVDRKNGKRI